MATIPDHRLYVPGPLESGEELRLNEERSRYATRVLRLRRGDKIVLFNGGGGEFAALIEEVSRRGVVVRIVDHRERNMESPLKIHLIQGVSRGERMDFVVQKATELGVSRITPVMTDFSVVRLAGERGEKRSLHWARVAQSACEQCGRNVVPVIDEPGAFDDWLMQSSLSGAAKVLLHPGSGTTLAELDYAHNEIQLLIGPEGGLSDAEVEQALAEGFLGYSTGPRILRTETAAISAIAILQSRHGDLR
jgi:16S rRNA (uracil1498-N3)-methyltransferase